MKVSKITITFDKICCLVLIIMVFLFIGFQSYHNFIDHRNIFPKKSEPEYVFKCPKCGHITEHAYKRCRSCNELIFYRNIKIKNVKYNDERI